MKIPKSVNIFGKKIKLKRGDLGPNYLGMYYPDENMIVIGSQVKNEKELVHVVVHELMHAIFDRCSVNQVVSYPNEEMIVDMTTKCFIEMFDIKFK